MRCRESRFWPHHGTIRRPDGSSEMPGLGTLLISGYRHDQSAEHIAAMRGFLVGVQRNDESDRRDLLGTYSALGMALRHVDLFERLSCRTHRT